MANKEALTSISLEAAGDLSAEQYTFVVADANGRAAQQTTAGGDAIGVLMDKPAALGRAGEIAISGGAKVVAGAVVAAGAKVQSDATGRAITAASGDHVLGTALTAATAADEVISVLLGGRHILA